MQPIFFNVTPARTKISIAGPGFVLEQDNWNDHHFMTQYILSYQNEEKNTIHIGSVKILKRGQTKNDGLQISLNFEELSNDFCSVGNSLDYYERLRQLGEIGTRALQALRDVVELPQLRAEFSTEPGWTISLFRDQVDQGERFRLLAHGLVSGHYSKVPEDQQSFTFRMSGWNAALNVSTASDEPFSYLGKALPERINVVVGRNGSGKSTLLARLARVAFGSPSERENTPLSDLGNLEPKGIGYPRIVTVAFSPFDCFKLPGSDDRNRFQIAKDMEMGNGRFVFIGLRDFSAEVEQFDPSTDQSPVRQFSQLDDRVDQTRLKSISQLSQEFARFREKILKRRRDSVLKAALSRLEVGLFREDWAQSATGLSEAEVMKWFHNCSTGHKITLLVVFGLVANMEPNSLVLFDEPETHLHPPLLSAMMHALRSILEHFGSTALVATHSPVVVQESLARHVHVVRREGDLTTISPVSIETFGESIGLITSQVFGMESNATDFHRALDLLITKFKDMEKIENLFKDGIMSQQGRAYVLSRMPRDSES
ncbi:AAA family ATPase [Janthinobacterium sp. NKUCC08_JDC]|uniref:AAA family ATPase n=1 Tax=Janthinobacterium sp. NKUCC08_JDC TaxID=2842122 RepID=UPI001C5B0ADA|nr:AAA family ATPase [Janthinobacterium sp. NKUCC08_JDC]MBW3499925.1 AAA family ATPase [Janthinobacterium sp. NKUCC08_JDC]